MTQPPDSTGVEAQAENLQPVSFTPVPSDPKLAIYQARIVRPADFPGVAYALTVTTASPGDNPEDNRALQDFLGEIRAGLELFPGPDTERPIDEVPEPFYPDQQVMFAFELAESPGPEPVDVGLVVETTTTGIGDQVKNPAAAGPEVEARFTVGPGGRQHYWTSRNPAWARVDVVTGRGNIRNPSQGVSAPHHYSRYTRQVILRGYGLMKYDWHGNSFTLSVH